MMEGTELNENIRNSFLRHVKLSLLDQDEVHTVIYGLANKISEDELDYPEQSDRMREEAAQF